MSYSYSVVIPVYNSENYLDRLFLSLKNQTLQLNEIIVVDDGSEDGSKEVILKWLPRLPIKLIQLEENMGIMSALSRGVSESKGEWIFRIDSDDYWFPDHCEKLSKIISSDEKLVLVASRAINTQNNMKLGISQFEDQESIYKSIMWNNPLVHSSIAFRKSANEHVGGYSFDSYALDYSLILNLLDVGNFKMYSSATLFYEQHQDSLSRTEQLNIINEDRELMQLTAIKLYFKKSILRATLIFLFVYLRKFFRYVS